MRVPFRKQIGEAKSREGSGGEKNEGDEGVLDSGDDDIGDEKFGVGAEGEGGDGGVDGDSGDDDPVKKSWMHSARVRECRPEASAVELSAIGNAPTAPSFAPADATTRKK